MEAYEQKLASCRGGTARLAMRHRTLLEAGGRLEKEEFSGCGSPRPSWGLTGREWALRVGGVSGRCTEAPEPLRSPAWGLLRGINRAGALDVVQVLL